MSRRHHPPRPEDIGDHHRRTRHRARSSVGHEGHGPPGAAANATGTATTSSAPVTPAKKKKKDAVGAGGGGSSGGVGGGGSGSGSGARHRHKNAKAGGNSNNSGNNNNGTIAGTPRTSPGRGQGSGSRNGRGSARGGGGGGDLAVDAFEPVRVQLRHIPPAWRKEQFSWNPLPPDAEADAETPADATVDDSDIHGDGGGGGGGGDEPAHGHRGRHSAATPPPASGSGLGSIDLTGAGASRHGGGGGGASGEGGRRSGHRGVSFATGTPPSAAPVPEPPAEPQPDPAEKARDELAASLKTAPAEALASSPAIFGATCRGLGIAIHPALIWHDVPHDPSAAAVFPVLPPVAGDGDNASASGVAEAGSGGGGGGGTAGIALGPDSDGAYHDPGLDFSSSGLTASMLEESMAASAFRGGVGDDDDHYFDGTDGSLAVGLDGAAHLPPPPVPPEDALEISVRGWAVDPGTFQALSVAGPLVYNHLSALRLWHTELSDGAVAAMTNALAHLTIQEVAIAWATAPQPAGTADTSAEEEAEEGATDGRTEDGESPVAVRLAGLASPSLPLTSLSLRACGLGDRALAALGAHLETNATLVLLDLWGNAFGDASLSDFGVSLRANTTLRALSVGGNPRLTDDGICSLAASLSQFPLGDAELALRRKLIALSQAATAMPDPAAGSKKSRRRSKDKAKKKKKKANGRASRESPARKMRGRRGSHDHDAGGVGGSVAVSFAGNAAVAASDAHNRSLSFDDGSKHGGRRSRGRDRDLHTLTEAPPAHPLLEQVIEGEDGVVYGIGNRGVVSLAVNNVSLTDRGAGALLAMLEANEVMVRVAIGGNPGLDPAVAGAIADIVRLRVVSQPAE